MKINYFTKKIIFLSFVLEYIGRKIFVIFEIDKIKHHIHNIFSIKIRQLYYFGGKGSTLSPSTSSSTIKTTLSTSSTTTPLTAISKSVTKLMTTSNLFTSLSSASSSKDGPSLKSSTDTLSILTTKIFSDFISTTNNFRPFHSSTVSTLGFSSSVNLLETSTNISLKLISTCLFTTNSTGSQLNEVLSVYTGDLSGCLSNCSNQGYCVFNSIQKYVCKCNQYKTGKACQSDFRPCSSNPCLNNGTCSSIMNNTSFQCICQNSLYSGIYCEQKLDLCINNTETCFNNQGFCIMNDTQPTCKCLMGYSGKKCELQSTSLVITKVIINASSIVAIIVLVSFSILILCFDYTKYFLMKNKKPTKKPPQIETRFYYTPQ